MEAKYIWARAVASACRLRCKEVYSWEVTSEDTWFNPGGSDDSLRRSAGRRGELGLGAAVAMCSEESTGLSGKLGTPGSVLRGSKLVDKFTTKEDLEGKTLWVLNKGGYQGFLVRGVSPDSRDHGEGKYILFPNSWERRKANVQGRKPREWTEDLHAEPLNGCSSFFLTRVLKIANQFRHGLTMVTFFCFVLFFTLKMCKLKQTSNQSWSNVCQLVLLKRQKTSMPQPLSVPTSHVPPRVDFLGFPL